ncbi:MAG: hypothetical protein SF339_28310 [Blastocatellia bacterium]|nr:hypothetical protein [Blastocatellia bacterium]
MKLIQIEFFFFGSVFGTGRINSAESGGAPLMERSFSSTDTSGIIKKPQRNGNAHSFPVGPQADGGLAGAALSLSGYIKIEESKFTVVSGTIRTIFRATGLERTDEL